jgi:hypothetical protein
VRSVIKRTFVAIREIALVYYTIYSEFDEHFYFSANPGLSEKSYGKTAAVHHFITQGWRERLDPAPWFSTQGYLDANKDVAESGMNPFFHYIRFGRAEGRQAKPSALHIRSVVSAEFDRDFYRRAYPELCDHPDPLQHFLDTGWRERRDPNPGFSTDYYLTVHDDVLHSGINPHYHYLQFGLAEGRAIKPSSRVIADVSAPDGEAADETARPRTGVIVLVKNEIDIIETFLAHMLALFDVVVVIDHGSNDGTREIIDAVAASQTGMRVYTLAEPAYLQALVMNHVARTHPEIDDLDWLFLLDADEFLPFTDRAAFDAALRGLARHPVIAMNWVNAVPDPYWDGKVSFSDKTAFLLPNTPSSYRKIAFQPSTIDRSRVWIAQGNHALHALRNGNELDAVQVDFPVIHLPVRSRNQFLLKLNQGVLSYLQLGRGREKIEGSHWFRLQISLKDRAITDEILNAVVAGYGEEDRELTPVPVQNLLARGYRKKAKDFAMRMVRIQPDLAEDRVGNPGELLFRFGAVAAEVAANAGVVHTADAASPEAMADCPVTALETLPDGTIRRAQSDTGCQIGPLTSDKDTDDPAPSDDEFRFLTTFLKPSFWEIEDLTPTAWGGHIPFLFALVAMERPRRYVELGTHNGASFLAYCQAARRLSLDTHPFAIDTWDGDEHAGFYDSGVFDRFTYLLRKYEDFASFLRMRFDEAAPRFAPGSIDLLHIDGLHTYEAVREDYETWLPKMSDRGVILFHDTNVHERDFGVWRFWEEVKDRHPTLEMSHSHGLGVAFVGSREDRPITRLIRLMRDEPGIAMLLQQHFEEIGQSSPERFIVKYDLKQREVQGHSVAQLNEEIGRLRQALGVAESEREELRRVIGRG